MTWWLSILCCALLGMVGCGSAAAPEQISADELARSEEAKLQNLAEQALGSGAEVFAVGDFAGNGHRQAIIMNRLASKSIGAEFSRASIIQLNGAKWVEVLRCDEYLKNPVGYLTVRQAAGWHLDIPRGGPAAGLRFTPLDPNELNSMSTSSTIDVRWNPEAGRYQTFSGGFQAESRMLETPTSELK